MIPFAIFWGSLFMLLYVWAGYPLLLMALAKRSPSKPQRAQRHARVSVIIAARNEAHCIQDRLQNIFAQDYPGWLEVLVGSDGSSDGTADAVRRFQDKRVRPFEVTPAVGRAGVHNLLAREASGDILVFTDAETLFSPAFLTRIVEPFADPLVGCATGTLHFRNRDQSGITRSRSGYWRFEYFLRSLESSLGSLAIASGACMAVRSELFCPFAKPTYDVDFITPLDVVAADRRVVHVPQAVAEETLFDGVKEDFQAQVRMTNRNLAGTLDYIRVWFFMRRPLICLSIISHKLLRWATPLWLLGMLGANITLAAAGQYRVLLAGQLLFYAAAVLGLASPAALRRIPALTFAGAFCVANAAFLVGIARVVFGHQVVVYRRASH